MADLSNLSDEELKAQYQQLMAKKKNLSQLSNEQLVSQYKQMGGKIPEESAPWYKVLPAAEAQGLGNVIQNIGKTTGLISKEAEPWNIRGLYGLKGEPGGGEKLITSAFQEGLPWMFPEIKGLRALGQIGKVASKGIAPYVYYLSQGKSGKEAASEALGGALLGEYGMPAIRGAANLAKESVKPVIEKTGQIYKDVMNFPANKQALESLGNLESKIQETLMPKTYLPQEDRTLTHNEEIQHLLTNEFDKQKAAISQRYKNFTNQHADTNLPVMVEEKANKILSKAAEEPTLSDLLGVGAKSAEEVAEEHATTMVPKNIKLGDLITKYKTYKSLARQANGKAFETGVERTQAERKAYEAAAKNYSHAADSIESLIGEAGHKNVVNELKKIDTDFAQKIAPLYTENWYWNLYNTGTVPENFLAKLQGNTPGKAIARKAIKENPQLLKTSIGQFAKDTGKGIKKPGPLLEPYINKHPELKQAVTSYREQLKNLPKLQESIKHGEKYRTAGVYGAGAALGGGIGTPIIKEIKKSILG